MMTIEEIRNNAPYGATHYLKWNDDCYFFKKDSIDWLWLINEKLKTTELLRIHWFFGWWCKARYLGGPSHKLIRLK